MPLADPLRHAITRTEIGIGLHWTFVPRYCIPIVVSPTAEFDLVRTMLGPERPDWNVCWCLSYRLPSKDNDALICRASPRGPCAALVRTGPPPSVLANDGDEVVGWVAVHPPAHTSFARHGKIPHVDYADVWSVWCIRVRART